MSNNVFDFLWAIIVGVLAIAGTLVGVIYKSLDNRIESNRAELADLDDRVRVIETSINDKLKAILEKVS